MQVNKPLISDGIDLGIGIGPAEISVVQNIGARIFCSAR
jgi:hypothetical protein